MIGDKKKSWEALKQAIRLVGAVSEPSSGIPANLRSELVKALAALVWVSQSLQCPACGCWLEEGRKR